MLYFISLQFFFTVFFSGMKDAEIAAPLLAYISIPGTYGMLRYAIPKTIAFLKRKKYRYDFKKLMYLSNIDSTSKKSILYVLALQSSIIMFLVSFSQFSNYTGVKENLVFCVLGVSILVSMGFVFSSAVEILNNKSFFKQMKAFGYTDEEVYDVVKKELILYFMVVVMAGVIQILSILFTFFVANFISTQLFLILLLALFIPLIIVSIALLVSKKNIVKKNLVGGF